MKYNNKNNIKSDKTQKKVDKILDRAETLISEGIPTLQLPYHAYYSFNIFKTIFSLLPGALFLIPLFIPLQFERSEIVLFILMLFSCNKKIETSKKRKCLKQELHRIKLM